MDGWNGADFPRPSTCLRRGENPCGRPEISPFKFLAYFLMIIRARLQQALDAFEFPSSTYPAAASSSAAAQHKGGTARWAALRPSCGFTRSATRNRASVAASGGCDRTTRKRSLSELYRSASIESFPTRKRTRHRLGPQQIGSGRKRSRFFKISLGPEKCPNRKREHTPVTPSDGLIPKFGNIANQRGVAGARFKMGQH